MMGYGKDSGTWLAFVRGGRYGQWQWSSLLFINAIAGKNIGLL
jgi:hypothetical protein